MMELAKHPQREGQEVRGLTDSLVSREEEERHQRMVSENEQLKGQIAEVRNIFFLVFKKLNLNIFIAHYPRVSSKRFTFTLTLLAMLPG
jgi:hypothetical protein